MFLLVRVLAVLLLCACWQVRAAPAPELAPNGSAKLVSQDDCFSGRSYDEWMDYLWEQNSLINYFFIRWKFPKDEYDRYRDKLDCQVVSYHSDQYIVYAWLVRPKHGPESGKLPVIIYNRGGNRGYGALTFAHLFSHVFPLSERGYVVAASQYRGATTPQDSESSPDQFGGDDVRDVTNLVRIVAGLPMVDPRRFFMIGQSRGAIMTFRALLQTPVPIQAVAVYSGVYDVHDLLETRPAFDDLFEVLIPRYRKHKKEELDRRSVTVWADQLPPRTGVLMIHGDEDERAPLMSARKLAAELQKLDRPHKIIVYPGESHFLDGVRSEVREQTLRWFGQFSPQAPVSEDDGAAR